MHHSHHECFLNFSGPGEPKIESHFPYLFLKSRVELSSGRVFLIFWDSEDFPGAERRGIFGHVFGAERRKIQKNALWEYTFWLFTKKKHVFKKKHACFFLEFGANVFFHNVFFSISRWDVEMVDLTSGGESERRVGYRKPPPFRPSYVGPQKTTHFEAKTRAVATVRNQSFHHSEDLPHAKLVPFVLMDRFRSLWWWIQLAPTLFSHELASAWATGDPKIPKKILPLTKKVKKRCHFWGPRGLRNLKTRALYLLCICFVFSLQFTKFT